jgi:hypothetical protein
VDEGLSLLPCGGKILGWWDQIPFEHNGSQLINILLLSLLLVSLSLTSSLVLLESPLK